MPIIDENEYTFMSADGKTPIHVHEWVPDCDLNGVIQIAHGVSEYIERYERFARFMAAKGFVVVGNDHLGHGKSVQSQDDLGYFADTDGWIKVVDDIEALRALTETKYPGIPYFLFGHSMGSFLTRTYLCRFPYAPLAGVILSGTGQNPAPVIMAGALTCDAEILHLGPHGRSQLVNDLAFGAYNKDFQPERTPFDWLSRDEKSVDKYVADPLCGFNCTVNLYRDMMFGLKYISEKRNLDKMNKELPVYFMSGDKDPVGANGVGMVKAYTMFVKAGVRDVKYKLYPDGRHEMLNELNRDEVMKDISDWIFSKVYTEF